MSKRIIVLIPTHGRPTLLGRTLASLGACRLPDAYAETVVVENGSRAGAEAVVAEAAAAHPALRLRYLHVERANKSHALNVALETIGDGLVVFFDDDLVLDPDLLHAYDSVVGEREGGAFFGGSFRVDHEEELPEWLVPYLPFSVRGVDLRSDERPIPFLGANWAAFAEDIRAVGGFNPNYGPGSPTGSSGQETEMQERLLTHGVEQVDVPDAWVEHHVPPSRRSPDYAAWWRLRRGVAESQLAMARGESKAKLMRSGLVGCVRCGLVLIKKRVLRDEVGAWRALYGFNFYRGLLKGLRHTL
jgi:GT2 family glycosyltransferase